MIFISNPPIGIAASLVRVTIAKTTSSSSSSISIFTSVSLASKEAARWLCWSLIPLTLRSTKVGSTSMACRIGLLFQRSFKRVSEGKDQSTAATVWFFTSIEVLYSAFLDWALAKSLSPNHNAPIIGMI